MSKRGLLVVYSGPSGCGKGTVLKKVMEKRPEVILSVSATTRAPRKGETDGVEYSFCSRERFEQMIAEDTFLEYTQYSENYYGTPRDWVDARRDEGKTVFLEIEVQGGNNVMKKCPEAVSIFLEPPSMEELERRLRGRESNTEEDICRRLEIARQEMEERKKYRYHIVNNTPNEAARQICEILDAEQEKQA